MKTNSLCPKKRNRLSSFSQSFVNCFFYDAPTKPTPINVTIQTADDPQLLDACADMMCASEPWITLQRSLPECREAMRGDYKEVFVARDGDRLKGFIVLQMVGVFKGYIQSICVAPDARGEGLGSALIEFAEKRIFAVSPNIFMLVSDFNQRASSLYARLGFEKIGVLKDFVVTGRDEVLLRKSIGPLQGFTKKNV